MTVETPGIVLESRTGDNKLWVQSTSRPIGTFTCFSSQGDSQDSAVEVGGGTKSILHHNVGDAAEHSVYVDYNVKENKTYISEGYVMWKGCEFDEVNMNIVPRVTPYTSGTNTTFNLYGGYLILPAANDGTIAVDPADIKLVEIPFSMDVPTQRQSPGYWDADYDDETHTFSNITPNLEGTGAYNIFGAEINFETVADITLLSDDSMSLHTSDVAELGHGMRIKYVFKTIGTDHEWKCAISLTLNRKYSAQN